MAGYMGDDDDDSGMGLQMIPKPGAQGLPPAPQGSNGAAVNMRPVLAQAGQDQRSAQAGWEDALRNSGQSITQGGQNMIKALQDKLMGGQPAPQGMPSQGMASPTPDQMDDLRNQMLAQRAQAGGQMTPEMMARFQKLKAALGGQAQVQAGQPRAVQPQVAVQPGQTQDDE